MADEVKQEVTSQVREPEMIDIANLKSAIGRFLIVWRGETKQVAKITEVTDDEVVYEMTAGPDKGKKFRAKYFGKTLRVFDSDNLILAVAE